ncbi:MAG TPA: carboxypeptidase-like regulatory domain-containing protein, partial [Puia sp.]|nr:carboxypeptidase-like regulatory domain-containing protein [Puia sp.]
MARPLLFLLLFISSTYGWAQEKTPEPLVTVTLVDRPFPEAMTIIESRIAYKFAYSTELAQKQKALSITAIREPLSHFLSRLFEGTSITWRIIGDQVVLQIPPLRSRVTISGYIRDAGTGESLIGATVNPTATGIGVLSNSYGFYSLTVTPSDTLDLMVSYVGYKTLHSRVNASDDMTLSLPLQRDDSLEAIDKLVVARDSREDNVTKNRTALIALSSDMIVAAPSVNGSGDVIGSVEMLPGVQAGIDGSPGYFVRGGNAGQNLILLDDATLYNPSHIFGLVGIFNPPTVKHATLMKGGFPASYGDHLSSVLDVAIKDGSNQQPGGSVQMGSVSSGVTVYGPLQTGKSSYLISAR